MSPMHVLPCPTGLPRAIQDLLLPVLSGPHFDSDAINACAHDLIDLVYEGVVTEQDCRFAVASLVGHSLIHEDAVRRINGLSRSARSSLADSVLEILQNRIIEGGEKGYRLDIGRTSPLLGWCSKYAIPVVLSKHRQMKNDTKRDGETADPTDYPYLTAIPRDAAFTYSNESEAERAARIDEFCETLHGVREQSRRKASAKFMLEEFGVKPLIRPDLMEDRDAIVAMLEADRSLARRSAQQWRDVVYGGDPELVRSPVDDRLLYIWDDQTPQTIEAVCSMHAELVFGLVMAEIGPRPRPTKQVLAELISNVIATNPEGTSKWRTHARTLARAWVAAQFEAIGDHSPVSADKRVKIMDGYHCDRARLEPLLVKTLEFEGHTLGSSVADIRASLEGVTKMTLREVERRAAEEKAAAEATPVVVPAPRRSRKVTAPA